MRPTAYRLQHNKISVMAETYSVSHKQMGFTLAIKNPDHSCIYDTFFDQVFVKQNGQFSTQTVALM